MAEKLKDLFFTRATLSQLAEAIEQVEAKFDRAKFLALVFDDGWEAKELKARMRHAAICLGQTLPKSYVQALKILKQVAPQSRGFDSMVFPEFVEVYGLEDCERSLPALGFFTRFGSSEFAVRPFCIKTLNASWLMCRSGLKALTRTSGDWQAKVAARVCRGQWPCQSSKRTLRQSCLCWKN
jgi:3-methyladenine DNA glycosylase AlkC